VVIEYSSGRNFAGVRTSRYGIRPYVTVVASRITIRVSIPSADVVESIVRCITATLEPRPPRHCWSAFVCRPDSPPNLLIETLCC
jgi:hypothetical protein